MADSDILPQQSGDTAEGRTANLIYILYLLSLIFGITSIIGVIMAYVNKGDAPDWVESHYRFQIRTFWISLLFSLIALATIFIVIGWALILFIFVWFIIRCVKGMKYLSKGEAHPDPASWMFG